MLDFKKYGDAEPALRFFEELSAIPHGSGNTGGIADYLVTFALHRGLFVFRDEANNVIIRKPATRGYEDRPAVIFQGHTDMVAEKKAGSAVDMSKDGLSLYIDGDFLRAKDTTLGGDDGVAIAYALAVLDSHTMPHPSFEAVFTSDEEIGLIGAAALNPTNIGGRLLINIDSDVEGVFTVGCAGGLRMDASLPIKREKYGIFTYVIELSGLQGGHSGVEIDKGRLNATLELIKLISAIPDTRIIEISGGNMDNAIPRLARCVIASDTPKEQIEALFPAFISERSDIEPSISVSCNDVTTELLPLTEGSNRDFCNTATTLSSGVIAMSQDIEGLVETSKNLGILRTEGDEIHISYSLRSSVGAAKEEVKRTVRSMWEGVGATVGERGEYPAWEYKRESHLRDTMCKVFHDMYGRDAEVITIHAGLECGIFSDKIDGLDCVSIGPDNFDIHTTEERLSLSSFARVWEFLKAVLKEI